MTSVSRYTSWERFMADIVDTADSTVNLKELFDLTSHAIVMIILKIIISSWVIFNAIVLLLSLAFPSFLIALGSFTLTPMGIATIGIFGVSMAATMKLLYQNRQLPIAIKKVGDKNKDKYDFIREKYAYERFTLVEQIDSLMFKSVKELISLAENEAEALKAKAIASTFEKIYLAYTDPEVDDVIECVTDIGKAVLEVEKENLEESAEQKIKQLLSERLKRIQSK
ncbi:hypothetical protein NIES4071_82880 [Calothrix sp. NIES-4071]|nr:hypothetical protein NIES4071_82880 [Calothrix sp. NIES-4071]BAZ62557.1 hypothetical protein NIES4105_82810 [Calothrix sp. NIES-4105]